MTDYMITKDNGEFVDAAYLRRRVSSALSRWRNYHSLEERRAVIARTLDDPAWMRSRRDQTVGSIIRAVEDELI
jgi:hypothetical protein